MGGRKIRTLCRRTRGPKDNGRRTGKRNVPEREGSKFNLLALISLLGSLIPFPEQPHFMTELRVSRLRLHYALPDQTNQTFFTSFVTSPLSSVLCMLLPWPAFTYLFIFSCILKAVI